jgi:hypothetical protein
MENKKQTKECKSCKSKNPISKPKNLIFLGGFILFTSIYGTIELVKHIVSWLK